MGSDCKTSHFICKALFIPDFVRAIVNKYNDYLKLILSFKLKDWRVNVLGTLDTPQVKLLNAVERKILEKYTDSWIACDQFAAAAAIQPKVLQII